MFLVSSIVSLFLIANELQTTVEVVCSTPTLQVFDPFMLMREFKFLRGSFNSLFLN